MKSALKIKCVIIIFELYNCTVEGTQKLWKREGEKKKTILLAFIKRNKVAKISITTTTKMQIFVKKIK